MTTNQINPYVVPILTKEARDNIVHEQTSVIIMNVCCAYMNVNEDEVKGKIRRRGLVETRILLSHFLRKFSHMSLKKIGARLGGKDHSTVCYYHDQHQNLYDTSSVFRKKSNEIQEIINKAIS